MDTAPTDLLPSTATVDDHLSLVTWLVFRAGMGDAVVATKWDGLREAFDGLRCADVASLTPVDVDRLVTDARVIRNRRKIEATIVNAAVLLDLEEQGGVAAWLAGLPRGDAAVAEVRTRFSFLGPTGATEYLWRTGTVAPPTVCAS